MGMLRVGADSAGPASPNPPTSLLSRSCIGLELNLYFCLKLFPYVFILRGHILGETRKEGWREAEGKIERARESFRESLRESFRER